MRKKAPFNRTAFWVIPFEMMSIYLELSNLSGNSELDDNPIMTGDAFSPSLPTFAHVRCFSWKNQIVLRSKEMVIASHHLSSVLQGCEVDERFRLKKLLPV